MAETSTSTTVMGELSSLIKTWEDENSQPNYDPVPILTRYEAPLIWYVLELSLHYFNSRLAEIVEVETENYLKMDPDPFDERHPSRTDPSGTLGQVLKALFKKENFTNKVT